MDKENGKGKKNVFLKTWERCRSIGGNKSSNSAPTWKRSKSWHSSTTQTPDRNRHHEVTQVGCFPVYVGQDKQRFVIKTKYINHPLFKMLLDDAESQNGFNSDGPLLIPCDANLFVKVLAEMDAGKGMEHYQNQGCGRLVYGSCSPFSPSRRLRSNSIGKGYGSYKLLSPSTSLKMNDF